MMEYPEKLSELVSELVVEQTEKGNFYKPPGKWCKQCDYLPVCSGNRKKAQETLVQIIQPYQL
jgi:radical SAM protein with 4Fe4S-binding SPASM domain